MRLTVLGSSPGAQCFILRFKETLILLDCGVELNRLTHFYPLLASSITPEAPASAAPASTTTKSSPSFIKQVGNAQFLVAPLHLQLPQLGTIDLGAVDVILISNYQNMLALPFISEHTDFKGRILATQPTIETARQVMEEFTSSPFSGVNEGGHLLSALLPTYFHEHAIDLHLLKQCYSARDVEACLNKVESLSFGEQVEISAVRVCPLASGFSLGAAYWQIQTDFKKLIYLPEASSVATRHPEPLDVRGLTGADVLLLSRVAPPDLSNAPDLAIDRAVQIITGVLKEGGNVLVPTYPSGIVFDLIEALATQLPASSLGSVPFYFISPAAETALAYSNICSEWLCKPKQDKAYVPEPPFVHAELEAKGTLRHFPDIGSFYAHGFRDQPCVVFAGHPSLRCGPAPSLVRAWAADAKNAIVFIEPDFPPVPALAPFQPLSLRVFSAPIDVRLSFSEANALLREARPKLLVIPSAYAPLASSDATARSAIISECPQLTYTSLETLSIPLQNRFERGVLSARLAQELIPAAASEGGAVRFAQVSGVLSVKDSSFTVDAHPSAFSLGAQKRRRLFGLPRLPALLAALDEKNIRPVNVTRDVTGMKLSLPSLSSTILCTSRETHVETENDAARHLLRAIILSVMK